MEITSKNIRMCSRLGQRGAVFGVAIPELAKKYNNIKVITADLGLTSGLERYKTAYPDKFLNVQLGWPKKATVYLPQHMQRLLQCAVLSRYGTT